jgi:hypothetical protein
MPFGEKPAERKPAKCLPDGVAPVLIDNDAFGALGGVGRSFAYELLKRPGAPKPVVLSPKVVRYVLADAVAFWQTLAAEAQAGDVPARRFRSGQQVGEAAR